MVILQEGDGQTGQIVLLVYALRGDTLSRVWISAVAFWKQSPEQRNWWGENLDDVYICHRIVELEGTLKALDEQGHSQLHQVLKYIYIYLWERRREEWRDVS